MHNLSLFDRRSYSPRYRRLFNEEDFPSTMRMNGSTLFESPFMEHFHGEPWPSAFGGHHSTTTRRPVEPERRRTRFEVDPIFDTHRRMVEGFHRHLNNDFQGFHRLDDLEESSSARPNRSRRRENEESRARIIPIQVIEEPRREFCAVQNRPAPKFIDAEYISDDSDYDEPVVIGVNNNNNGVRNLRDKVRPATRQSNSRTPRTSQDVGVRQGRTGHRGRVDTHTERPRQSAAAKSQTPQVIEISDSLTDCFKPSTVGSVKPYPNQSSIGSEILYVDLPALDRSRPQSSEKKPIAVQHIQSTPGYPIYAYLKSKLDSDGRQIDYIQGDGNCFFRALSKEIYGLEEFHSEVRQAVMDVIEKYPKEFEQFLDDGTSLREHINEMRLMSTWSSTMEIYGAATLLQRNIYVLSPNHTGETYNWLLFSPRFTYNGHMSYHPCYISLCHTNGNHYDRIAATRHECNCKISAPKLSGTEGYVDLTNVELSVC